MNNTSKGRRSLVADKRYSKSVVKPKPQKKAPQKRRKPKRAARGGLIYVIRRWILRLIWNMIWRTSAVGLLILLLSVGYVFTTLPNLSDLLDGRARGSVTLLDREGDVFAWRGDQFGGAVRADTVSPHLRNAVVATEDKRFYGHLGISPRGIASAVRINLSEGRGPLSGHGGSTITQQVAKLLCLGKAYDPSEWKSESDYVRDCRRSSLSRKAQEAIFALAMEAKYSKDDILSIYLNRAYMGGGAYGAEAASNRYFGKSASRLTIPESAMLAGLLTAPSTLSPTRNLERSQNRAATVVRMMREQGYVSPEEEAKAQANPARLSKAAKQQVGGYYADWVMSSGPEFFTRNTTEDVIISTTLDQRLQKAAEEGLQWVFDNKVSAGSKAQAAIVVMSADGSVRAMVGGRAAKVTGAFNRATQAMRQTGSAFKPFVYATAIDLGYSPLDTIEDAAYCLNIPGSGEWCPNNYTKKFEGIISMTRALEASLNIPAVKISENVGRDLVRRVASDFGINSQLADGPALALGASESTLLEMTGAYAGILNGGSAVTPFGLLELSLLGDDTPLMGAGGGIEERVIQESSARQLIWMMEKVVSQGTGQRAQFDGREIAGKTGTTQGARDAWFIGFTGDYVAGVWMGYDDNTMLTGVTGGGLPADIWRETMQRVHEGVPIKPLPMQEPNQPQQAAQPFSMLPDNGANDMNIIENLLFRLLGRNDR